MGFRVLQVLLFLSAAPPSKILGRSTIVMEAVETLIKPRYAKMGAIDELGHSTPKLPFKSEVAIQLRSLIHQESTVAPTWRSNLPWLFWMAENELSTLPTTDHAKKGDKRGRKRPKISFSISCLDGRAQIYRLSSSAIEEIRMNP